MDLQKTYTATAIAHANIAVAKYWGKRDTSLNLPLFDSVAFNVEALTSTTTAVWTDDVQTDVLIIDDVRLPDHRLTRCRRILDKIRYDRNWNKNCILTSNNSFPQSSGLASSASGYAAIAVSASIAAEMHYNEKELSSLARMGSGSASRSIPSGWTRWYRGSADDGSDSYAAQIAPPDHWNLIVFIVQVSDQPKTVSSTEGMEISQKSPFWESYCIEAQKAADIAQSDIINRDFKRLTEIMHHSSMMLHGLMLSCNPPICYFAPKSIEILQYILKMSKELPVCCTMDAGANIVVLCEPDAHSFVKNYISSLNLPFIQTKIGEGTHVCSI